MTSVIRHKVGESASYELRYHVPHSQVWHGSRGRQTGNVHFHVVDERFDVGRIHRKRGDSLCGHRGWYERAPEGDHELDPKAACPRCTEIAARVKS